MFDNQIMSIELYYFLAFCKHHYTMNTISECLLRDITDNIDKLNSNIDHQRNEEKLLVHLVKTNADIDDIH